MEMTAENDALIEGELKSFTASMPEHMSTPTFEKIARANTDSMRCAVARS